MSAQPSRQGIPPVSCPASREAVEELELEGDTGCTICGAPSTRHLSEEPEPDTYGEDPLGGSWS